MSNCEYEKNGHCTLNECMYGDFLFIDDSAFETGKHCTLDYELPSKNIDEMIKQKELKAVIQDIHDNVYEQGVRDFAKYLIDKHVENYSDIADLVWDFLNGK